MGKNLDTLFENLKVIATAMTETFGRNCEVAVHDLRDLNHSLIHIAGNITGRKPGAPITDLVLGVLREKGDNAPNLISYKNAFRGGRVLKSSTIFIRDERNKIVGALCINYDLADLLSAFSVLQDFVRLGNVEEENKETFAASVQETVEGLVNEALDIFGKQPATMQTKEKIRVVSFLEKKGTFLIKGAVDYIAMVLGVSKFTVYNYLQKIRSSNELGNGSYLGEENGSNGGHNHN